MFQMNVQRALEVLNLGFNQRKMRKEKSVFLRKFVFSLI